MPLYKSIDINFKYPHFPAVPSLAQHAQTSPPVQEEPLWPNSAAVLDEALRWLGGSATVFSVHDPKGLLVTGPADHDGVIFMREGVPGFERRSMATSSMTAGEQHWMVL